ncbi:Primosomal protein N' [uncultured Roseburia sp.]|uniref:Replication restart protein PriA n=1 Tax=Brotonthovivens ammoniilytica TaxID=2981725 RepID=A0ABT2TF42_9FIRM|nr:primosomal protein N' [Brotonthovivens ammoniilytica]MCU6760761.1 primosomal protein N' [Brotonthovivens ammoniilytica]SCI08419.1 Primosomal protein N' [uncultured Roseburia sp.]
MAQFANIIIDISHEKVDKTFQYKIPEQLQEQIQAGVKVRVPFGRGNGLRCGYVVEVTDQAEFERSKIKEIAEVVSGSIAAEAQMIAFAAWIRQNYGGTMNQALKTVLPVKKIETKKERRIVKLKMSVSDALDLLEEFQKKHRTARARLLKELMENKQLPYEVITRKLNVTAAVVRALEEADVLEIEVIRTYRNPIREVKTNQKEVSLNDTQKRIVSDILARKAEGDTRPSLIHGVTGSGKTEVYIELIANAVKEGRQAIVLIPEIALTFQTVMRFYRRFGSRVSILNSRMSAGERYDQYERAKAGELDVMIGPRSALFTPFSNLGFIMIDEEHEASYKSETVPRYHAREAAVWRGAVSGACVILGSATPSVESYQSAKEGRYQLYEMLGRIQSRPMAKVYVEDLREELRKGNRSILSDRLRELIEQRLAVKEQIMLFINRRGVAGFVSCRSCGAVVKCPHCDVSLSLHNNGKMVCHYCGYEQPAIHTCPECGSKYIGTFKAGTQKIEAYLKEQFPEAVTLRMDLDTTRQKDGHEKILSAFANREADILIGTQMIVKGHDFPNVTLVGVLAADLSLHVSDYRAAERTFQLLTQAAGRAGRGSKPGEVVIQTYQPEHYSIQAAKKQDYQGFFEQEIAFRSLMRYPPVWNLLVIHISSPKEEEAAALAELLKGRILDMNIRFLQIIGPADPAVAKVNDIYRKVIYLKQENYSCLVSVKDTLELFIKNSRSFEKGAVQFDFNPMNGF